MGALCHLIDKAARREPSYRPRPCGGRQSLDQLAQLAGEADRVRARAYNQAVYNSGWAIGVLGAGTALAIGSRQAYLALVLADAASYVICALLLLTLPAPVRRRAAESESHHSRGVLRSAVLTVSLLNGLLMTYGSILTVALPLWIVERTSAPAWMVAALFALNTFLAITLCVRLSRGAQSLVGAARAISRAGAAQLARASGRLHLE